ncbi:hypothetical protein LWI29_033844 [Acer saccharum]|uniref:Uncharacterized protein n=1 Tax=Acer saccharum TaxID=4024 RepID=A0AA39SL36_ACESA|nr:hypothetical protein LWI29_033844 [Acer saccharum]
MDSLVVMAVMVVVAIHVGVDVPLGIPLLITQLMVLVVVYWPQQNSGRGLLGAHPSQAQASQWCSKCSTPQHSYSNCPHRYHGPESLTAPFAGMHVAQYPPPLDFTYHGDVGFRSCPIKDLFEPPFNPQLLCQEG